MYFGGNPAEIFALFFKQVNFIDQLGCEFIHIENIALVILELIQILIFLQLVLWFLSIHFIIEIVVLELEREINLIDILQFLGNVCPLREHPFKTFFGFHMRKLMKPMDFFGCLQYELLMDFLQ